MTKSYRIFTGLRPTGPMHLGHYLGILRSWSDLQTRFQCYFCVADLHALTSSLPTFLPPGPDLLCHAIAAGVDPNSTTLFYQSKIPEHAELFALLSTQLPVSWLEKNPTFRNSRAQTIGLLGYPLLMLVDMLLYSSHFVCVGRDQVPHIGIAREIVRKLRKASPPSLGQQLVEPTFLLPQNCCAVGTDGNKMSKSHSNAINLGESAPSLSSKVQLMRADDRKVGSEVSGEPEVCSVWLQHQASSSSQLKEEVRRQCEMGGLACPSCKRLLTNSLLRNQFSFFNSTQNKRNHEVLLAVTNSHHNRARVRASRVLNHVRIWLGAGH